MYAWVGSSQCILMLSCFYPWHSLNLHKRFIRRPVFFPFCRFLQNYFIWPASEKVSKYSDGEGNKTLNNLKSKTIPKQPKNSKPWPQPFSTSKAWAVCGPPGVVWYGVSCVNCCVVCFYLLCVVFCNVQSVEVCWCCWRCCPWCCP